MQAPIIVTTFYKFFSMNEQKVIENKATLDHAGADLKLLGLTLIAQEGINGTVAGRASDIEAFKQVVQQMAGEVIFKDSPANEQPFKRWHVKIRPEIVAIGDPAMHPDTPVNNHLPPSEWNHVLATEDVVVLDTRNRYETMIGKFKNAIDPNIESFDEFPEYVKNCDIPKDKKVLMYCTGGIRCEKALIEMKNQGYEHVYQLQGGILQYFKEQPHTYFEGECFVFDHRSAVDQDLNPSKIYATCPHCGDPGDVKFDCNFCSQPATVCTRCNTERSKVTCSKDCQERLRRKQAKEQAMQIGQ
jgi:UPF0176 protein